MVVLGISKDSVASQKKFEEKYGLPFALLSDPEHAVIEAYDVWNLYQYGKCGNESESLAVSYGTRQHNHDPELLDNDGIADIAERRDGQPTTLTSPADMDGDGLLDIFEAGDVHDGFVVNDKNWDSGQFNMGCVPTLRLHFVISLESP